MTNEYCVSIQSCLLRCKKGACRTQITGWKTKSVQNHDRSAFWARYPTKATNQKVQSAADLGMDGGSMFYLPRFPTHWHRNCRVPLYNEPHFFCCCAQCASSIFSSYWPNARKLAIPSWMVELVCLLLHYVILWQQSYANAVECFGQNGLHGKWMNLPKQFKLQNHSYTVFLLQMHASEKGIWVKCNLMALEDVKAVARDKHTTIQVTCMCY